MAAHIETAIWLALRARVETLAGGLPVAWPGQTYRPGVTAFLRVANVSSAPEPVQIENDRAHQRAGSLMVTLVYPLGQDVSVYVQTAADIARHFAEGTEMWHDPVCVSVTRAPHVMDGHEDNGFWTVPIRIPWRCVA